MYKSKLIYYNSSSVVNLSCSLIILNTLGLYSIIVASILDNLEFIESNELIQKNEESREECILIPFIMSESFSFT